MSNAPGKKLTLYTNHLSPNGLKVSIYLEELKLADAKAFEYKLERVDLQKGVPKDPAFVALNAGGRIPILVDNGFDNFPIFEGSAILLYLDQHCDTKKRFSFDATKAPRDYSSMLQWIFFCHGSLSPIQGQAHFFMHFAPVDVPYGKKRFHDETKRSYDVLNQALTDRQFFVGPQAGRYTIADMNVLPWIKLHKRAGIETLDTWPNLKDWFERCLARPAVQAAINSVAL